MRGFEETSGFQNLSKVPQALRNRGVIRPWAGGAWTHLSSPHSQGPTSPRATNSHLVCWINEIPPVLKVLINLSPIFLGMISMTFNIWEKSIHLTARLEASRQKRQSFPCTFRAQFYLSFIVCSFAELKQSLRTQKGSRDIYMALEMVTSQERLCLAAPKLLASGLPDKNYTGLSHTRFMNKKMLWQQKLRQSSQAVRCRHVLRYADSTCSLPCGRQVHSKAMWRRHHWCGSFSSVTCCPKHSKLMMLSHQHRNVRWHCAWFSRGQHCILATLYCCSGETPTNRVSLASSSSRLDK